MLKRFMKEEINRLKDYLGVEIKTKNNICKTFDSEFIKLLLELYYDKKNKILRKG